MVRSLYNVRMGNIEGDINMASKGSNSKAKAASTQAAPVSKKVTGKALVTLEGSYYLGEGKTAEFTDLQMYIPEDKAPKALAVCLKLLKKHIRVFLPDAKRLEKVKVKAIESDTLSKAGKPVDVMSLAELLYVINDKEMVGINPKEFPTLADLRHAVKLYLVNEKEAMAYIKANKEAFNETRELMELNPTLVQNAKTYLSVDDIEAAKVKVAKPDADFNKVQLAELEAPQGIADTDPETGKALLDDDVETEASEDDDDI